jgi:hypothetical protein
MNIAKRIYINNDFDIVTTRMQVRATAKEMGFRTTDQARISLAAAELARVLAWKHNHRSEITLSGARKNGHQGMQVVCLIDLDYIETGNGSSSTKTASPSRSNLAGVRQLVDESKIEVLNDKQARVTLMQWLK